MTITDFKPIASITPRTNLWENGTWKFNIPAITPIVGGSPSYQDIVVSGIGAVTLSNSLADGLNYVKLFGDTELLPETYIDSVTAEGKCVQSNLAEGYTQVDYLEFTGTQYFDTGVTFTTEKAKIEIKASYTSGSYGNFGACDSSGHTYALAIYGTGLKIGDSAGPSGIFSSSVATITASARSGSYTITKANGTTSTSSYTGSIKSTKSWCIGGMRIGNSVSTTFVGNVYLVKLWDNDILVFHGIPCRRNSDNVLGIYDKVSGNFLTNQGTGDLVAGSDVTAPSPDTPIDIVCNNGTIKTRMRSGLPSGYTRVAYIGSTGTQRINTGVNGAQITRFVVKGTCAQTSNGNNSQLLGGSNNSVYTFFGCRVTNGTSYWYCRSSSESLGDPSHLSIIDCTINSSTSQTGTLTDTVTGTTEEFTSLATSSWGFESGSLLLFGGDSNRRSPDATCCELKLYTSSGLVRDFISCKNSSGVYGMYDTVNNEFYTNAGAGTFTAGADDDSVVTYTDGTPETITDNVGNVANCQNLLSVGTYKDTQEILSGAVSKNIGIKVLDGTEDWALYSANDKVFTVVITELSHPQGAVPICTHFTTISGIPDSSTSVYEFYLHPTVARIYICNSDYQNDLSGFKSWLATQYANGTPVIVVYPLATATTETVSGQVLTKAPVTYSGSISGLTGTVVTSSHSTPTPTQPLQINCNNGVVKVSPNVISGDWYLDKSRTGATGALYNLEDAVASEIVPVQPSTQYTSCYNGVAQSVRWYEYDNNKNYISGSYVADSSTITTSSITKYISVSVTSTQLSGIVADEKYKLVSVNRGETALPYIAYGTTYADGTQEKVEVFGKNLFDKNAITENKVISADGSVSDSTIYSISDYIPVIVGATYIRSDNGVAAANSYFMYNKNKEYLGYANPGIGVPFTISNGVAFIRFNVDNTLLNVRQLELGSTATTYEPYYYGGSALAEMLLKVGTYQDEQEVLEGDVTRKVGIKVLDGTENITVYSDNVMNIPLNGYWHDNSAYGYCTHYEGVVSSITAANMSVGQFKMAASSASNALYFKTPYVSANNFKAWLSDQYNSGNPVIVIYPLATATTESVTGQTLTTQAGNNIVEITQASMDNLSLEVSYKGEL